MSIRFLDLFAGAGGLSEGFIQAGFEPVAHVESDKAACFTLRTRRAYHWLKSRDRVELYADYLSGNLSRLAFYEEIPKQIIGSIINAEIGEAMLSEIFGEIDARLKNQQIDLIVGGPPCQGYSLVGRSRGQHRKEEDKRNNLYIYYAEFLKKYKPSYFIFENVTGLLSAKNKDGSLYFEAMKTLFSECGYTIQPLILRAEEYGVLQSRKRVILVGKQGKDTSCYLEPDKWNPATYVKEAFYDLPDLAAGEGTPGPCRVKSYHGAWQYEAGIKNRDEDIPVTWHQARPHRAQDLEIYRIAVDLWDKDKTRLDYNSLPERLKTHRHRNSFVDRFKVVAGDLPSSHTVVAHIAKDGHYYIHPDVQQNRSITPREAARLQTFPDNYYFESSRGVPQRTPTFCQIGNAVPVLLARKIADKLKEVWS